MSHGCGVKSRIDAAKQNVEVRRNNVAHRLCRCSEELFFGRLPRFRHETIIGSLVGIDCRNRSYRLLTFKTHQNAFAAKCFAWISDR